jgi:hopanoid biosynthesis associated RND transporter like protein HpnN
VTSDALPPHPPPSAHRPDAARPTIAPKIGRLIAGVSLACARRPVVTIAVAVVLGVAGLACALSILTFISEPLRLLPQREPYVMRLEEYQRDFGELNDVIVVVQAPSPDVSKDYAARLTRALRESGVTKPRITYRVDPAYFDQRALLYLSVEDLTALRDRLFDNQAFIDTYARHPALPQLLESLNQQIAGAMLSGFFDLGLGADRSTDLRFLRSVVDQIGARLHGTSAYSSPWAAAFSMGRLDDPDAGYFFSADRHWLFVLVQEEGEFAERRGTIEAIRRAIAQLEPAFPDVHVGVTGGPTIANDEMITAFDDSKVATRLAFALTLGLLVIAFRRVVRPVLILVTLVASLSWSLGIIALVIQHLSIFSVMFISIVVAIGTDYGIYFLYRYEEERRLGYPPVDAIRRTGERAGPGILLGALTAGGAFIVLMLTKFLGIREFGFVSAISVLMAFVAMITVYPAALVLVDRRASPAGPPASRPAVPGAIWLEHAIRHRRAIMIGALCLTGFAVWAALQVRFSYNMLKLQAKGVESVLWEERILSKAGRSGFAALATATSIEELEQKRAAFAALPSVAEVESVLMLLPDRQPEKIALIRQIASVIGPVQVGAIPDLHPAELLAPLRTLARRLSLASAEGGEAARNELQPLQVSVQGLLDALPRADARQIAPGLANLQDQIARDFADKLAGFRKNLSPRIVEPGETPPELRRRYIGASGRYLLRVQPAVDIWQREGAERFVTDLRSVDPAVTGPPITSFEAIRFIRRGYLEGTLYALVLVTVVTAIILRSAFGTVLALVPLVLGVVWTMGFMHVFDLSFNLANVWALPLIIGTAAEFGLNIFVRFQEGRDTGTPALAQSTVMAVVLNGFTTMAGFASLMVAHHRGIFGLGLLLTVGMIASLIASLGVLPVLLRIAHAPARRLGDGLSAAPKEATAARLDRAAADPHSS